ncbi:hypothetical protein [Tautonia marina]|uniref:hypothetical protein n=1 Tax=Tautonia marina TaxID=2653855 RepID=UPI0012612C8F|nr:hypothetical protein [Tautonia marina]
MKLNADVYESLKEALTDALGLNETQQLARPALNVDWEKVFADKDLIDDRVEKLIRRAEQLDRVHILAVEALKTVPTNQKLQTFIREHFSETYPPPSRFLVRVPVPDLKRRVWIGVSLGLMLAFGAGGLLGYALRSSPPTATKTQNPWDAKLVRPAEIYTPLATPPSKPSNWPEVDTIADQLSRASIRDVDGAEIANLVVEFGPFEETTERTRIRTLVGARSYILAQLYKRQGNQEPTLVRQPGPVQHGPNPLLLTLPECKLGERLYMVMSIRPSEPATTGGLPPDMDRTALRSMISFRRLTDDDEN